MICRGPGDQASPLDNITRLPDDLLAKVLYPLACALDTHAAEGVWEAKSAYKRQADLYRMRLVCRKFNVLFSTHGFLLRNMVLKPHIPCQSNVSLLAWARAHTSVVRTLVSCSCPCLELACKGLSSPSSSLSTVECYNCHASALPLLSSFAQLATCKLHFNADSIIDLSALQAVSSLQLLELGGGALKASALPLHLRELMLYDADLATSKACCCVTSLQKLTLRNSILQFHPNGLSACCALKEFGCQHSSILAQQVGLALRSINNQVIQVPRDVSALSCLTGLSLGPYAGEARSSFLDRYFCLTNLSSLHLVLHTHVKVSSGLTALQQLSSLSLWAAVQLKYRHLGWQLDLEVPWSAMRNLQDVTIECGRLSFSSSLLELVEAPNLRSAAFRGCKPAIGSCLALLESLMHQLRQHLGVNLTYVSLPDSL